MIRKSRKQKLIAEINITPFTDVILVLLVIFMITTPLMYQSKGRQVKVNLPKSRHVMTSTASSDVIQVTISSEGPVYLEGNLVTLVELESQLSDLVKRNPTLSVVLEIDRLVAFKNVVRVLDVLNSLNIEHLRIAAEEEK